MNHYETLGVEQTATIEEIKRRYQSLILQYHPDKNNGLENEKFLEVNKAWNILKNSESRKEYDSKLLQRMLDHVNLYATIDFDELEQHDNEDLTYSCRCGGTYFVNPSIHSECIIPCDDCSLALLVKPVIKPK